MRKNQKKHEIDPLPTIPAIPPIPPDFVPEPEKDLPGEPTPEIKPVIHPEIDPSKEHY